LFDITAGLYALVFLLVLFRRPALFALGIAVAVHIVALQLRIYILARPPVGTLYESGLFVALIIAITGLITRRASISGLSAALLLIAPVFAQGPEGFGTLTAVLNTNFWLTVHVLTITAGYGLCLAAAAQAH